MSQEYIKMMYDMTWQQLLKSLRLTSLVEWTTIKFRSGHKTTKDTRGQQLLHATIQSDAAKARTLLSTPDAQSFINYQDKHGVTPLFIAALTGHAAITNQLLAARYLFSQLPTHKEEHGGREEDVCAICGSRAG